MAVTSVRRVSINFSGDYEATFNEDAASNAASPGQVGIVNLAAGNNTITIPSGATALTIILPAGNLVLVTLKGINGDTGVVLHLTDPTSIALSNSISTLVLNAGVGGVNAVRLVWS